MNAPQQERHYFHGVERKRGFTLVDNEVIDRTVEDGGLEGPLLAVLVYLWRKPSGWTPMTYDLMRRFGVSRPTAQKWGRELEALGFVRRWREQDEQGRWSSHAAMVDPDVAIHSWLVGNSAQPVDESDTGDKEVISGLTRDNVAFLQVAPETTLPSVGEPVPLATTEVSKKSSALARERNPEQTDKTVYAGGRDWTLALADLLGVIRTYGRHRVASAVSVLQDLGDPALIALLEQWGQGRGLGAGFIVACEDGTLEHSHARLKTFRDPYIAHRDGGAPLAARG